MLLSFLIILFLPTVHIRANIQGIIVSGGSNHEAGTSVEVFNPVTNNSCELPSLPKARSDHTMDGLTICGGGDYVTCLTFSSGQWVTSHALTENRDYHCSWSTGPGIVLLGGAESPNTTEIVLHREYEAVPGFSMQYITS